MRNLAGSSTFLLLVVTYFAGVVLSANDTQTTTELAKVPEPDTWYEWNLSDIWKWLTGGTEGGRSKSTTDKDKTESRTFGLRRKIATALIPIMFKFGVLSAMITLLVFLAVKTFFLIKALFVLNLGGLLAKLLIWKSGAEHGGGNWNHGGWAVAPTHKEIHIHVHNNGEGSHGKWQSNDPYSAYSNTNYQYVPIPLQQRTDTFENLQGYNQSPDQFQRTHNFVYHGKEKYV